MLKRTKLLSIGAVLLVASIGGAQLVQMMFNAHQLQDIPVPGQQQAVGLYILPYNYDYGMYIESEARTMQDFEIPYTNGTLGNGETYCRWYSFWDKNTHNYNVTFEIADDWFEDPQSPYYGFTYGVKKKYQPQEDLNGQTWIISPGDYNSYQWILWYQVDPYFSSPPNGTCPVRLWVNASANI